MSPLRHAGLRALVLIAGVTFASPPAHALPKVGSGAVVSSVDGPTELTVKIGKRKLPVRLLDVDAPRPGECGAQQTTAALRGFARRAPRRLHFAFALRGKTFARDASGRLLVTLAYPVRKRWRDLGNDLARAGWAREGAAITLDAPLTDDAVAAAVSGEANVADEDLRYSKGQGLAATCGGLTHLPLGSPVPKWEESPVWNVNARGVTTAIGTVGLDPVRAMTVRELAAIVPVELYRDASFCWVNAPTLGLMAFLGGSRASCGDALVIGFFTDGTRRPTLSRGGGVGRSLLEAKAAYPLLDLDGANLLLSGEDDRTSAWQTMLDRDPNGDDTVTGLITGLEPPGADRNP